jgi:hypothetical protein
MTVKETKNYTIFQKHAHNRELTEGNVLKIMRSLQVKNLLEYRPILVDAKMRIIDGQHRLEAAKRLDIPVYYQMQEELIPSDIIQFNDKSKPWAREDYLNFWCTEGNVQYIKLKNFMDKNKISLSTSLAVLGLSSGTTAHKRGNPTGRSSEFKEGKFVFPSAHEEVNSINILHRSQEIIDYINPKIEGYHRYIHGPAFRRALYVFLSIKAVEHDVFMDKLAHRMDLVRPCSRITDYVHIFKMIYNWHNRNPITLDEFV